MLHFTRKSILAPVIFAFTLLGVASIHNATAQEQSRQILDEFILEEIDLTNVTMSEAIDFLRAQLSREFEDKDAHPPNLLIVDPSRELADQVIAEFKARNMPASVFLSYICEMTRSKPTYQDRSVAIRPLE